MNDARARKFDAVVVWKLDRFGRSMCHLVNPLAQLEALGGGFVSLQNSLDFTTPGGKLQFHVLAAVAEFERELIRERVRAGMQQAKRKSVNCGRLRTKVDGARVRKLRSAGASWSKVARELRVSRTVCQRVVN
jgi:DNA invertase Pin-like site-specific DNA recombinase